MTYFFFERLTQIAIILILLFYLYQDLVGKEQPWLRLNPGRARAAHLWSGVHGP